MNGVRDARRPPFCYQTHAALDAIRDRYEGDTGAYGKPSVAIAVYVAATEYANRNGGSDARDGFTAPRRQIANLAGVSPSTLDLYRDELVAAGVLEVERRKEGETQLPSFWRLVEPPSAHTEGVPVHNERGVPADWERGLPADAEVARAHVTRTPKKEAKETGEEGPHIVRNGPPENISGRQVRDAWLANAPPLIKHRPSYFDEPDVKRAIQKAIGRYDEPAVVQAIRNLATVIESPNHFFTYRGWTLKKFLQRGLDEFVPEANPLEAHRGHAGLNGPRGMTADEIEALGR